MKKLPRRAQQIIINEYVPGNGITGHIDSPKIFGDVICSISLLEPTLMTFTRNDVVIEKFLEKNSIVILEGDARYKWKHEISKNKTFVYDGKKFKKQRRVSITTRTMK